MLSLMRRRKPPPKKAPPPRRAPVPPPKQPPHAQNRPVQAPARIVPANPPPNPRPLETHLTQIDTNKAPPQEPSPINTNTNSFENRSGDHAENANFNDSSGDNGEKPEKKMSSDATKQVTSLDEIPPKEEESIPSPPIKEPITRASPAIRSAESDHKFQRNNEKTDTQSNYSRNTQTPPRNGENRERNSSRNRVNEKKLSPKRERMNLPGIPDDTHDPVRAPRVGDKKSRPANKTNISSKTKEPISRSRNAIKASTSDVERRPKSEPVKVTKAKPKQKNPNPKKVSQKHPPGKSAVQGNGIRNLRNQQSTTSKKGAEDSQRPKNNRNNSRNRATAGSRSPGRNKPAIGRTRTKDLQDNRSQSTPPTVAQKPRKSGTNVKPKKKPPVKKKNDRLSTELDEY